MPKKQKGKQILYVKLRSLDDLCRYACNFDYTNSIMMMIKSDSAYRIFTGGEGVGDTIIVYYVNAAKKEGMISYTYPSGSGDLENSHFVDAVGTQQAHYMNIIGIENLHFKETKKIDAKLLQIINITESRDLISTVARKGVSNESIPYIYSFEFRGEQILCAFDIVDEFSDEGKILYYSVAEKRQRGNFARYKYSENRVEFTDHMGEHSYIYAKIIHLAEPFSFFKMPE